jgi:uncharacterized protein (TIGR02001 family)
MKKTIFMVSACVLANSLLSQNVAADTFQSTSNTAATPAAGTTSATTASADQSNQVSSSAPQTTQLHKGHYHKKRNANATVAANATMKDQAPNDKAPCWMDNLTGQMDFTSNYVFRGVSQTENLPAVQGGLTYQFPIGAYFNLWGSNVKFTDTDATIELDTIAGWRGNFWGSWSDLSYDLNIDRYNYPGASELAYNEFNSVFNYKIFQFGYSYSANAYASHGPGRYYIFGLNYDIPSQYTLTIENVSAHATIAHYTLPKRAGDSYNDYSIWISKKLKNYTLTLQWTDTNGRQHNSPYDSSHIFAILNADF